MTAKLFRNSMAVAVSVMALSIILFMGVLYQYFSDQMMEALGTETWLVARGVELEGLNYLDGLDSENRVTWVAADGTVLFDSSTDSAAMENHGNREEIREAQENRLGAATRYSSTLAEQTLYSARRLSDGTVIRLASSQRTVWLLLLSMVQPILVILVLALLLSVVLASRLSRSIIRPIAELDLEHPEDCDAYDELAPLLTRIKRQNDTIKQQMGQLQQKQTEFSALTENMAEGFLLLDRQGRVLSHNPGALRLLGAEEPVGEVNALFLNREEHFRRAVDEVLEGHRSRQVLQMNGRCCQLLADPVWKDGEPAGAVLVLMDVTEQEKREELRREFTANVSHELKTPLTSISGFAEIMQDGFVKDEDVKVFAGRIYKEAQRLIRLVGDVIRISRLDEGGLPYQWEKLDLYSLTHDIFSTLHEAAEKQEVHMYMEGGSTVLDTVPTIMEEVLYNVCDNAVKYNHRGGEIFVRLKDGEDAVRVNVRDTGIGIPKEDQERIFERFYRVDKSHSKEIGGTGLGLSIVKHGVKTLNGRLWLNSEPGQGTEIIMEFPKHHMEKEAAV